MKKLLVFLAVGLICACATTGASNTGASNVFDLDTAIQASSKEISDALNQGTKVALLNFSSSSDVFSDYVLEEMSIALVKERKLLVVDRREIDLIRGEMNFQMSGDVSDESAQEIGAMLGAQSIVSGSLVSMGDTYRFRTKVINVNTAAIETSGSLSIADSPQIQHLLAQGSRGSAPQTAVSQSGTTQTIPTQASSSDPSQPAAPAEPALQTYRIGDTGPAGGLIFYDKGNNSGGWRYLEAAPVEAEFRAVWSVHNTEVENTRAEIGSGRRNTQLIVEKFRQTSGEWDTAAQKSDDLVLNGFDDWFLPSQAELDQMYGNLKRRNLGDFKNEWYWSSTENEWRVTSNSQNFSNGSMDRGTKRGYRHFVRPIRQVPGPDTARSEAAPIGNNGTGAARRSSTSGKGSVLYTLLGLLVIGGVIAFIIWGPTPSGATT